MNLSCISSESSTSTESLSPLIQERTGVKNELYAKFVSILATRHEDPVVQTFNGKQVSARKRVISAESGIDLFVLERTDMGVTPAQCLQVMLSLDNYARCGTNVKKIELLSTERLRDMPVEIYCTFIKAPNAFIAERIFFDAKYIWPEENLVIMSSLGNANYRENYCTEHARDIRGVAHASTNISGFKWSPVLDSAGEVVGTSVVFLNESDFGGSMPKWFV